jgi:hypothetical protein
MDCVCDICGNEKSIESGKCPFCGYEYQLVEQPGNGQVGHRFINIERGRPTVEMALKKLARELEQAMTEKIPAVTIIHGYGASGRGGVIRVECRKTLDYLEKTQKIRGYISGENFSRKEGKTRTLLRRLPKLGEHKSLNKGNKGITVIEL